MQTLIELLGLCALAVVAGSILFVLANAALWAGDRALKLHPVAKFKAWRKRRNARAVVQLKAQIKELREDVRDERAQKVYAHTRLEQLEARHRQALAILHSR